MNVFVIALGLMALMVIWIFIEQKVLVTTEYRVCSDKLDREFDQTRFVVLADLHNHSFGLHNQRLMKKLDTLAPDFIIVSGDMITKRKPCIPSEAFTLMKTLAEKYTIYYAYGNHEQRFEELRNGQETAGTIDPDIQKSLYATWVEYKRQLQNAGILFLDNEKIALIKNHRKMYITGLSLPLHFFGKHRDMFMEEGYLDALLGKKTGTDFQILIAHNPAYFENYIQWGADLTLSGHVHGGLVRLPVLGGILSPQVKLFPKYDAGRFFEHGQEMIISRGMGVHSVMFRLFNPPELVLIRLLSGEGHASECSKKKGAT